jgi:hypothetical protein
LASDKVLTHVWPEVAQQIVGSSCLIFDVALSSASGEYMSHFLATAWSLHPDLIPSEVGCVAPEPEEPSVVGLGDHPQQAEHALVQGLCKGNRGSQLHSAFRFFRWCIFRWVGRLCWGGIPSSTSSSSLRPWPSFFVVRPAVAVAP